MINVNINGSKSTSSDIQISTVASLHLIKWVLIYNENEELTQKRSTTAQASKQASKQAMKIDDIKFDPLLTLK